MDNVSSQSVSLLDEGLRSALIDAGAVLVGYADLTMLPEDQREGLPMGVAVAVLHQKDVIRGISVEPTREYREWYDLLNNRLDSIVTTGAQYLTERGYNAVARTRAYATYTHETLRTTLPHKTVARLGGLGWIGKCALLVTPEYGSMVRISALVTDAPLTPAHPTDEPRCGNCHVCVDQCPGHAPSGRNWSLGMERESFFDARACETYAREVCTRLFGDNPSICGKCIAVCPHTRRYLAS
ncbi:hypothetical protein FACS1894184_12490 [Clostridia bacterium]|nr:hypothetical protein FACS1894184_12490 [Clostridia bacterium]